METFLTLLTQIMISSPFLLAQYAGVNLLVGTENGLMLLDRSGQGKVYNLINRRRFQQMDVLEGLNVLVTISGIITTSLIWNLGVRYLYLDGFIFEAILIHIK